MTDIVTKLSADCHDDIVSTSGVVVAPVDGPLRVDVISTTATDVVSFIGGWLCDRARNGWAVNVHLANDHGARALHILGLSTQPFDALDDIPRPGGLPHVLAVATDVFVADVRVRADVVRAVKHKRGRVVIWGEPLPQEFDRRFQTYAHQLSPAARAFKAHATTALGNEHDCAMGQAEEIRGRFKALEVCDSDLTPVTARERASTACPALSETDSA